MDSALKEKISLLLQSDDYPVTRERLMDIANEQGADQDIKSVINTIPERVYNSWDDLEKALNKVE